MLPSQLIDQIAAGEVVQLRGANGAGKTTTIGKLAKRLQDEGKRVMLAAGDTFRAAAVEQLQVWGERNNVPVISQQAGADPAAVVYDAYQAAKSRGIDVLLADTAGRLQNQQGLMDELAKIKRVVASTGGGQTGGPFKEIAAPAHLDWNRWLGQAPLVPYSAERCHGNFRWWGEYAGGQMTDWGAHHVDIAQWALDQSGDGQGVLSLDPLIGDHPLPLKDGMPTKDDHYNTSHNFHIRCMFPEDTEMNIVSKSKEGNGILFEGSKGNMFVSRGKLSGEAVNGLKEKPLESDTIKKVYKGKKPTNHMENFFKCVQDRSEPLSAVFSHHRAMTTCHLANISIRLGRKLKWDPKTEQIVDDEDANVWQSRKQRKGFETDV